MVVILAAIKEYGFLGTKLSDLLKDTTQSITVLLVYLLLFHFTLKQTIVFHSFIHGGIGIHVYFSLSLFLSLQLYYLYPTISS